MSKPDISIDPRILESAKKEFLSCGYEKASTNVICKNAGVTSGALYKRYSGKDELFRALVSPVADKFKDVLKREQDSFHSLSNQEKEAAALGPESQAVDFVDYIYENFDTFKLLISCSTGSSYESYLDELVDIIVDSTICFMKETGHEAIIQGKIATPETIHILISSYLYGFFEPVTHGMTREKARTYVEQLKYFFNVGWADILQLKK
ncbi:MAG: TetR/AcrR family transcriptional regulator [Ruminococcus sp.]|nr:TetR/AcrR family transcriptional regulator [Ruminococcus sp.]